MHNEKHSTAEVISYEEFTERSKNLKTLSDVTDFVKTLIAPTLQKMLEAELDDHLGYKKYESVGKNSGNSRNGNSTKVLKTSFGQEQLKIPRDRNGTFEPLVVKKYETVESDVEEKIVSMYAKGMTTRDITDHMNDIYGVDVSAAMISAITDKVLPLVEEWQARPLASLYPVVYLDGIHFKVRDGGRIVNKCAYTALGVDESGYKELLGLWVGTTEGAKFWLGVLNEIKNRGVDDMLIVCVDGLTGFSEAIQAVFPTATVQQCVIHQIRNSMKYVPSKHRDKFCKDLRTVYTAPTEEAGRNALAEVKQLWPQYALYLKSWETHWSEISPFFSYPASVRKVIYTTNAVESVHHQLRKVTKTTTIFPHDEALKKLLWLAQRDIAKKWTSPIPAWGDCVAQFAIMFPDKIKI
ncbi:IS256 family transposase [Candidatus Kaiserbacteria bacterium]|nr:IS256 family transposase [Candidatus Kaiserbacteria bacterium]